MSIKNRRKRGLEMFKINKKKIDDFKFNTFEIGVLKLSPDDIVILKLPKGKILTGYLFNKLRIDFIEFAKIKNKVIILEDGLDIEIMKKNTAETTPAPNDVTTPNPEYLAY